MGQCRSRPKAASMAAFVPGLEPELGAPVAIKVTGLDGAEVTITADTHKTVGWVKRKVEELKGPCPARQQLYDAASEEQLPAHETVLVVMQRCGFAVIDGNALELTLIILPPYHQCTYRFVAPGTPGRRAFGFFGGRACTAGAFDTNGALYHISTKGGKCEYTNPHSSGEVIVAMSSVDSDDAEFAAPERFVMHEHDGEAINMTNEQPGQWMRVDLGEGRSLVPNHYCLRHGSYDGGFRMLSWRLEGSHDSSAWATLREHEQDDSLPNQGYGVADWAVEGVEEAYRYFRIVMAGPSSDDGLALRCAGIELYGEFRDRSTAETH
jgi:hypothetical protein